MLIKLTRLPNGMPCLFLGKLKVYLTKWSGLDYDNLNSALYIDIGYVAVKWKKNYKGHFIT